MSFWTTHFFSSSRLQHSTDVNPQNRHCATNIAPAVVQPEPSPQKAHPCLALHSLPTLCFVSLGQERQHYSTNKTRVILSAICLL